MYQLISRPPGLPKPS